MTDYLDGLNEQQRAAVEYIDGPSLVIAGAGSGKTRVLTNKIAYLLDHGYEPWSILALTFTNKAANEMKERIAKQVGHERARYLWMGTFHSVFSRILRAEAEVLGFTSDFTIYDASDSKSLIKTIINEMQLDESEDRRDHGRQRRQCREPAMSPTSVMIAICFAPKERASLLVRSVAWVVLLSCCTIVEETICNSIPL